MVLPRVHDLMTCVLPQIDDSRLLRLFRLRVSLNSSPSRSPRVLPPGVHDLSPRALLDLRSRFSSAFGASGVCLTPHLETSEVVFPEVSDLSTRIPCRSMDRIYFDSSNFGSFKLLRTHFLPKCIYPKIHDLLTRIPLAINDQDLLRLFVLLLVHKPPKLWILRHLSSLTMDGPKLLRDFGTLTSPLSCAHKG
jgi:hypothetical protein